MLFKTEHFKVTSNNDKDYPVGTPKIIRELTVGEEIYFEMNIYGTSKRADAITIHNVTKGTSHEMKKGNFFNAITHIAMDKI